VGLGTPSALCTPLLPFLALEAVVFSSFLCRLLLSVWLLSPFGRDCGSFRAVWLGRGSLCAWGGAVVPVSWSGRPPVDPWVGVVSVADAWVLCRFFWR